MSHFKTLTCSKHELYYAGLIRWYQLKLVFESIITIKLEVTEITLNIISCINIYQTERTGFFFTWRFLTLPWLCLNTFTLHLKSSRCEGVLYFCLFSNFYIIIRLFSKNSVFSPSVFLSSFSLDTLILLHSKKGLFMVSWFCESKQNLSNNRQKFACLVQRKTIKILYGNTGI